MKPVTTEARFFVTPAHFRKWLLSHHGRERELWVGFYRKASGRPSITWPESVDEALCVGWIDGLRKTIDAESYRIRFTPRKARSTWSAINIRRVQELTRQGRMLPAGLQAFAQRTATRSRTYSYENRKSAVLDKAAEKQFRSQPAAWKFFLSLPEGYRSMTTWWVISARQAVTRQKRLTIVITDCAAGRRPRAILPAPAR